MPAPPSTASPQNAAPWMRSGIWFLKPETLRAHSFEVWKNIFVLAHAFCVQALFTESYQIPINPVSSQLWRTAKTILWPFWEGHPTSNGNTVIAEKEKKKKKPASFLQPDSSPPGPGQIPTYFLPSAPIGLVLENGQGLQKAPLWTSPGQAQTGVWKD